MKTQIRVFGAFRDLCPEPTVEVEHASACSLGVLKELIEAEILKRSPHVRPEPLRQLLNASAWANDEEVLGTDTRVEPGARLALLPPVCGG